MDENIGFCERINSYFIILKTTSESNHFLILSTKESHASLIVVNILTSTISIVVEVVVISDICREVDEICCFLSYYTASSGNFLPMFWDNL